MNNGIELVTQFTVLLLTAVLAENAVFSRGLATTKQLMYGKDRQSIFIFGGTVTFLTTLSGMFTYFVNHLGRQWGLLLSLRSVGFVLCISICYLITCVLLQKYKPQWYELVHEALSIAAFGSAVLGSVLVSARLGHSFTGTLGYSIGSGLGLTLGMILVHVGRRNMELCHLPKTFRGLPITLVYIGIVSLAIYGLIGHQLPI